jgi:cell division protein FtsZ
VQAAQAAIESPLLEEGGVEGAKGILINIIGSSQLSLHDVNEACLLIRRAANNEDAQINFGVVLDESLGDEVKLTVIATGFERASLPTIERPAAAGSSVDRGQNFPFDEPVKAPAPAAVPVAVAPPAPAAPPEPEPSDIEVPAFLRRRRAFN